MTMWPQRCSRQFRVALALGTVIVGLVPVRSQAQVAPPPGWRWGTDRPARMTSEWNMPDSSWRFVQMAPGWHITTRPGALMYDPAIQATGSYVLESIQILFPGTTQTGYGLFFGGRNFDGPGAHYVAFLARRDGHVAVEEHRDSTATTLIPWTQAPSVQQVTGDKTARNVFRIAVRHDSVLFEVNGVRVAATARTAQSLDGFFGFRTGPDLNLHVTTLDYTRRLAPVPKN